MLVGLYGRIFMTSVVCTDLCVRYVLGQDSLIQTSCSVNKS